MRAGTPLTLGLCRTIRRPTPESAPTDAKASCLYPNSSRGVAEMLKRGFDNGIVLDALGNVAETCSSNIFLAKNGVVATPMPNGSFLAGITRNRTVTAPAQRRRPGRRAHRDDRPSSTTPTRSSPPAMPARCNRSAVTRAATCSPARSPARRTSSTWRYRAPSG